MIYHWAITYQQTGGCALLCPNNPTTSYTRTVTDPATWCKWHTTNDSVLVGGTGLDRAPLKLICLSVTTTLDIAMMRASFL